MSSSITFRPIAGAHNEGPLCYLLIIDDFHILLDCGWDDHFNVKDRHIQELKKIAKDIDVILLSHSDISHVGALPYLIGQLECTAKIYATLPVVKMGLMFMYDTYQNRKNEDEFDVFNLDDVDSAFDFIKQLKYSQRFSLVDEKGKGTGIVIAPHAAGHSLGGTIWKISKETDEIVYAVDYNHRNERHLNPAALKTLSKPSILITDSYAALSSTASKQSDTKILDLVKTTLRSKGNVLIPCDTAGRVFELMLLLELHWREQKGLTNYGLVFLTNMSYRTMQFASHQLEWMSESIMKGFDERRENPFNFKHMKLCHSLEELKKGDIASPMVVLTTSTSLETGFSRELFIQWSSQPDNLVLLTDRSTPGTLTRKLADQVIAGVQLATTMKMVHRKRLPLEGEELKQYELKMKAQREIEKKKKREEEQMKRVIQIRDEEDSDDEQIEKFDEMMNITAKNEAPSHPRLFLPVNMRYFSQHLMFPCIEQGHPSDEYGQAVDVDELKNRSTQLLFDEYSGADDEFEIEGKYDEEEKEEKPTKCIKEEIEIYLLCNVQYVDYEGRSNGQSIKNILQKINPRKLVIIHGGKDATKSLRQYCEQKKISDKVETPSLNETIDITLDTNMFKVKLREDVLNQMKFVQCGPYDLSYIEGEYSFEEDVMEPKSVTDQSQKLATICPVSSTQFKKGHPSLFIGDVKLSQFRDLLIKNGFKTQFQAGSLICNDVLVLRKDLQTGQIMIEGGLSPDYLKVKSLLFSQYQII